MKNSKNKIVFGAHLVKKKGKYYIKQSVSSIGKTIIKKEFPYLFRNFNTYFKMIFFLKLQFKNFYSTEMVRVPSFNQLLYYMKENCF